MVGEGGADDVVGLGGVGEDAVGDGDGADRAAGRRDRRLEPRPEAVAVEQVLAGHQLRVDATAGAESTSRYGRDPDGVDFVSFLPRRELGRELLFSRLVHRRRQQVQETRAPSAGLFVGVVSAPVSARSLGSMDAPLLRRVRASAVHQVLRVSRRRRRLLLGRCRVRPGTAVQNARIDRRVPALQLVFHQRLPDPPPRVREPIFELFLVDARLRHQLRLVLRRRIGMVEVFRCDEPSLEHRHRVRR
mmetsp:Transcript_7308/g.22504  ORF Transcript_7308/g.22504 Transcript_7308/m.22504 type:complete len:246 (+) Transcript_7308:313-1050(+)